MSPIVKTIYLTVSFLLEIAMLISYGYYGMNRPWNFLPRLLVTIAMIAAAIALWGLWAAPKSGHRLAMPYLPIFRASMFFLAAFLLYQSGQKNGAFLFFALTVVTQTMSYFTEK
ncbi:MAG: YrdB family protein [Spirosomataceae bacterium]